MIKNEIDNIKKKEKQAAYNNLKNKNKIIDIDSFVYKSFMNNKILIISLIPLFIGYYLYDITFTRSIAKATSDLPKFIENVDVIKILYIILPYFIATILFCISYLISTKTLSKIEIEITRDLMEKIIDSTKETKTEINVNDLMMHIKNILQIKNIFEVVTTTMFPAIIVIFGIIYNFSKSDIKSLIIVIIIIVTILLITIVYETQNVKHANNTEKTINIFYDEIHEMMTNIDTIITSNTQKYEINNFKNIASKTYELECKRDSYNILLTYGLQLFTGLSMLGIDYISYNLYIEGKMTGTNFASTVILSLLFVQYYNYSIHTIRTLMTNIGSYVETRSYFNEFSLKNSSEQNIIPENHVEQTNKLIVKNGNIIFKNITVKYGENQIFHNLNLEFKGKSITGLMGPIGSGKTTILKLLAGIVGYTNGEIYIDSQNLKDCTHESIVNSITYISQYPKLFNKSIYYNINYGSYFTKEEINEKINTLGLSEFINSFPKKIDTIVGKEGSMVSGGQKQFIAFIRSIVQNKSIFLLDEPSSSLDIMNKKIFINLIKKLNDKTIIISTHDQSIMNLFNNIIQF